MAWRSPLGHSNFNPRMYQDSPRNYTVKNNLFFPQFYLEFTVL